MPDALDPRGVDQCLRDRQERLPHQEDAERRAQMWQRQPDQAVLESELDRDDIDGNHQHLERHRDRRQHGDEDDAPPGKIELGERIGGER